MPKYQIMDDDDVVGVIILNKTEPTFQHTAPAGILPDSGPIANAVLFVVVSGASYAAGLVGGFPGWLTATAMLAVPSALHVVSRVWRGDVVTDDATDEAAPITIEHYKDDRLWLLDKITDQTIERKHLEILAQRIKANDFGWSQAITTRKPGGISQTKHNAIKDEFLRLGYMVPMPNNANKYKLTRTGRGVIHTL